MYEHCQTKCNFLFKMNDPYYYINDPVDELKQIIIAKKQQALELRNNSKLSDALACMKEVKVLEERLKSLT